MPVNIHGKEYFTVAERVQNLTEKLSGDYSLTTEIVQFDEALVVMKAILIFNNNQYTGHAFERSSSSQINKTSHLENCETSAIGRALAAAGYGGTEYASANEVQNAIAQQAAPADKPFEVTPFLQKAIDHQPAPSAPVAAPVAAVQESSNEPPTFKMTAFLLKCVNERSLDEADTLFKEMATDHPSEVALLSLLTEKMSKTVRDELAEFARPGFDKMVTSKLLKLYKPGDNFEFLNALPARTYGDALPF
tara:strand:- start:15 stop:761 length:747 start_codon:yes stop_codon:yes gene_type:complete